eukprot:g7139.t1
MLESDAGGGGERGKSRKDRKGRRQRECRAAQRVTLTSQYGLVRHYTARELAQAIVDELPRTPTAVPLSWAKGGGSEGGEGEGGDEHKGPQAESVPVSVPLLLSDVRLAPGPAGVILVTTLQQMRRRGEAGQLQCPACGAFQQGERGLWWHQKVAHGYKHAEAVETAKAQSSALVVHRALYSHDAPPPRQPVDAPVAPAAPAAGHAARRRAALPPGLRAARDGDLAALNALADRGWDASAASEVDRHGSGAFLWAAGGGHLEACRLLVRRCKVDPRATRQRGRRGFSGRTALHWAARNGHTHVMEWLLRECGAAVDEETDDGTTAFHWAAYQGQVGAMRWLLARGANARHVNRYGCNAALWAAQGGAALATCSAVADAGTDFGALNTNGHGALHKAAQRGNAEVCEWLLGARVGLGASHMQPDMEGFRPSALARLEGFEELACCLEEHERMPSVETGETVSRV